MNFTTQQVLLRFIKSGKVLLSFQYHTASIEHQDLKQFI